MTVISGRAGEENGPKAEKDKTEIVTGLGRRTREEIQKSGIKLAALRFQTEGKTSEIPRPPFGGKITQTMVILNYTYNGKLKLHIQCKTHKRLKMKTF